MMVALDNPELCGELLFDEPMARHTSWRVGGPARRFYRPVDLADLQAFMRSTDPAEPILWVGLGSNLLVRDGGFRGSVIATKGRLGAIETRPGARVRAEAGAACAHVARLAARHGLGGGAFLAGIPGTIGGALAMNAGAFNGETWSRVLCVDVIDRRGTIVRRTPEEYSVGYRDVKGPPDEWFVACELQFDVGDGAAERLEIRNLLAKRSATQPTNQPSGGSTFRNPPGDFAARLIEQAGLKGPRIGGAEVSEKHANFIINTGSACAADIEALIEYVRAEVERVHGIRLVHEVHMIGEAA